MSDNREIVKEAIICAIETVDDRIPVIGPLMDLPCVDRVERDMVTMFVDWVFDYVYDDVDVYMIGI